MSVTNSGSISTLPAGRLSADAQQEEESQSPTHRPCGIEGCSNKDVYRYGHQLQSCYCVRLSVCQRAELRCSIRVVVVMLMHADRLLFS